MPTVPTSIEVQASSAKPLGGRLDEGGGPEAADVPLAVRVRGGDGRQARGGQPVGVGEVEPGARRAGPVEHAASPRRTCPCTSPSGTRRRPAGPRGARRGRARPTGPAWTPGSSAACSLPSGSVSTTRSPSSRAEAMKRSAYRLAGEDLAGGRVDHRQRAVADGAAGRERRATRPAPPGTTSPGTATPARPCRPAPCADPRASAHGAGGCGRGAACATPRLRGGGSAAPCQLGGRSPQASDDD